MSKLDRKSVGTRVRKARVSAGFVTQARFAEAANVSDETISRIERGAYEPALSTMVDIAAVLGTSIDALVGLETRSTMRAALPTASRRLLIAAERLGPKDIELLATIAERLGDARGERRKKRK